MIHTGSGPVALLALVVALLPALTEPLGAQQGAAAPGQSVEQGGGAVDEKAEEKSEEKSEDKAKVSVTAGEQGFSIESADGDFVLRVRSLIQADARFYLQSEESPTAVATENGSDDDFLIRRARLELSGNLFKRFEYRLLEDFAPSPATLLDAWVRYTASPRLRFQVGKIKLPVGLEREQTREFNLFNEFAYPTALVPNRDIGLNVHGEVAGKTLLYWAGIYDGTPDGTSIVEDSDDHKTWAGRLFFTPTQGVAKGLGVGVAGTIGEQEGLPAPYRTIGQQAFFRFLPGVVTDGTVERLAEQLYYFRGSFGLMSEHVTSAQEIRGPAGRGRVENRAWHVTGTWVLSGEPVTFRGVVPAHDFDLAAHTWGAWQLVARVTELDVDDDAFPLFADPAMSSRRVSTVGVGIHWIMNAPLRLTLDYNHTELDGGALPDEDVVIARTQIRF